MTFEDIQKVNTQITTINIKGKEYAPVNERIVAFRKLYPEGFIRSEIVALEEGMIVMKATVGYYDEDGDERVLGTGTAYERETSSFINRTSYIENCESSAWGRALGALALGTDESIASLEEVANAITQQEAQKQPTKPRRTKYTPAHAEPPARAAEGQKMGDPTQEPPSVTDAIGSDQWGELKRKARKLGMSDEELLERFGVTRPSEITYGDYEEMLITLSM